MAKMNVNKNYKGFHHAYSLSRVGLFVTQWTAAHQASLSMWMLQARILEWVAMSSSSDLPNPGTEPRSPTMQVLFTI